MPSIQVIDGFEAECIHRWSDEAPTVMRVYLEHRYQEAYGFSSLSLPVFSRLRVYETYISGNWHRRGGVEQVVWVKDRHASDID